MLDNPTGLGHAAGTMDINEDEAEALVQALNWSSANARDRGEASKLRLLATLQEKARREWILLVHERRCRELKSE